MSYIEHNALCLYVEEQVSKVQRALSQMCDYRPLSVN